ncbi:MAG: cupin domain-containing protein [Nocardioides sp.]|uniref:cupin domain-containing protein n=1 Tax=Nocardioides sp. TaxID=35761 RepID=UPI0039E45715
MTPVDLVALGAELLAHAASAPSGRDTRVLHAAPDRSLTQVVLALSAGRELAEHENPGEATVQVLSGGVTLSTGLQEWTLGVGELLAIPQQRHALRASMDSVVLLTMAKALDAT